MNHGPRILRNELFGDSNAIDGMKREKPRKLVRFALSTDDFELSGTIAKDAFGALDPHMLAQAMSVAGDTAKQQFERIDADFAAKMAKIDAESARPGFRCPVCGSCEFGTSMHTRPSLPGAQERVEEFSIGHCHGPGCIFAWIRNEASDRQVGIERPSPAQEAGVNAGRVVPAGAPPRKK